MPNMAWDDYLASLSDKDRAALDKLIAQKNARQQKREMERARKAGKMAAAEDAWNARVRSISYQRQCLRNQGG